jgi:hypothetical protein
MSGSVGAAGCWSCWSLRIRGETILVWGSKSTTREMPEADTEWLTPKVRTRPWFSSQSLGPATEALVAGPSWQLILWRPVDFFFVSRFVLIAFQKRWPFATELPH